MTPRSRPGAGRFAKRFGPVALGWALDVLVGLYHRLRRTPLLGRLMLRLIERRTRGADWVVAHVRAGPLRGMLLHIDPRVQADVILGAYERKLSRHAREVLRDGDLAFDVGAHLGYFSILMATAVGASGRIVSFEADPGLHEALEENVRRNRALIPSDIRIVEQAIGSRIGTTSFATGSHSTRGRLSDGGDLEVEVTTLDAAVEQFGTPRFVKVDVEGSEVDVLTAAPRLLAARGTSFGIEIHSEERGEACRRLLEAQGYRCRIIREAGRAETYLLADP